jgi:hypothetical protein
MSELLDFDRMIAEDSELWLGELRYTAAQTQNFLSCASAPC